MRNFKNLLDAYIEYTEGHESTRRVRLWSIISVVAALLERRVFLERGYYTLFPNLYVFIIGKSGLIKKTTSTGIAVNLLREVEGVRIMSERLTAGSLIEQLLLAGKKYENNGKVHYQSALFAYASELSIFLQEVYGSITELLTTFYDCVPNDSTKPWIYHTIKSGEKKIYGPCLNILGASTKAWLTKCIPRSEMEGGFTSRIIFVVENSLPKKLVPWPELEPANELNRLKLIEDLRAIYAMAGEIKPSQEARDLYSTWYKNHMKNVVPLNQDPRMIGYMARKGDTILKLSMVHSVIRSDSLVIETEDLMWANEELDLLEDDWRMAFDGLGRASSLSYEIMNFVQNKTAIRKKELLEHFGQLHSMAEILKAINQLKGMDELTDFTKIHEGERIEFYAVPGWEELIKL